MKYIGKSGRILWGEDNPSIPWRAVRVEAPGLITESGVSYWVSPGRPRDGQPGRSGGGHPVLYPNGESGS